MAKSAPLAQLFFVHGRNLSGDVGSLSELLQERTTFNATGISLSSRKRVIGRTSGAIAFDAFFNDASEKSFDSLKQLPSTDIIATWAVGSATQDRAASVIGKQVNFALNRASDGALGLQSRDDSNAFPLEFGTMLTAGEDTHASATSSASVDGGAASSNGLSAYLNIVDIGSGTPTVVIEESSDDGGGDAFATLISFTAVADTNEPTAERKTVTGTIERYLRITTTGTFTNLDFAVMIRRGTAVDIEGIIT